MSGDTDVKDRFAKSLEDRGARFGEIASTPYVKAVHIQDDINQNAIAASRLLEEAVARGLITDSWAQRFIGGSGRDMIALFVDRRNESQRLLNQWSLAVGESWLASKYGTDIRPDAGDLDCQHLRATPEYYAWQAKALPWMFKHGADRRAGRHAADVEVPPSRPPEGSIICIEETELDAEDRLNRERARAWSYADACTVLSRIVRGEFNSLTLAKPPAAPEKKKRGPRAKSDPGADRKIAEAWATGHYLCFADMDLEFGKPEGSSKRAYDRHRKRQKG